MEVAVDGEPLSSEEAVGEAASFQLQSEDETEGCTEEASSRQTPREIRAALQQTSPRNSSEEAATAPRRKGRPPRPPLSLNMGRVVKRLTSGILGKAAPAAGGAIQAKTHSRHGDGRGNNAASQQARGLEATGPRRLTDLGVLVGEEALLRPLPPDEVLSPKKKTHQWPPRSGERKGGSDGSVFSLLTRSSPLRCALPAVAAAAAALAAASASSEKNSKKTEAAATAVATAAATAAAPEAAQFFHVRCPYIPPFAEIERQLRPYMPEPKKKHAAPWNPPPPSTPEEEAEKESVGEKEVAAETLREDWSLKGEGAFEAEASPASEEPSSRSVSAVDTVAAAEEQSALECEGILSEREKRLEALDFSEPREGDEEGSGVLTDGGGLAEGRLEKVFSNASTNSPHELLRAEPIDASTEASKYAAPAQLSEEQSHSGERGDSFPTLGQSQPEDAVSTEAQRRDEAEEALRPRSQRESPALSGEAFSAFASESASCCSGEEQELRSLSSQAVLSAAADSSCSAERATPRDSLAPRLDDGPQPRAQSSPSLPMETQSLLLPEEHKAAAAAGSSEAPSLTLSPGARRTHASSSPFSPNTPTDSVSEFGGEDPRVIKLGMGALPEWLMQVDAGEEAEKNPWHVRLRKTGLLPTAQETQEDAAARRVRAQMEALHKRGLQRVPPLRQIHHPQNNAASHSRGAGHSFRGREKETVDGEAEKGKEKSKNAPSCLVLVEAAQSDV